MAYGVGGDCIERIPGRANWAYGLCFHIDSNAPRQISERVTPSTHAARSRVDGPAHLPRCRLADIFTAFTRLEQSEARMKTPGVHTINVV